MRKLSPKIGLIDQPAARKVHKTPTPLGGGIGILVGTVVPLAAAHLGAWLLLNHPDWRKLLPEDVATGIDLRGILDRSMQLWWIIAGGIILSVMGLIDDLRNLPWKPRLAIQFGVAIGLVFGAKVQATLFAPYPWIGGVLSVFWILVLINSFNFLDNMDGLSAGIALVAALLFSVVMLGSSGEPRWLVGGVLLVFAGSLAGFLVHNWPPARIFMGDTGSYFIGLMMATTTLLGTYYDASGNPDVKHVILAPFCILAVPLYDFCSVMLIRLLEGRSPFHADKSHFSHRLVEMGLRPRNAVLTIHLATLTTGLGALLLYRVADWSGALLIVALICCVLAIVAILETVRRRNNGNGK
ncbi:MAG: MraY family glycosyltransferase [Planctomycetaceae bacterium]